MRILYYVPIMHTPKDHGTSREVLLEELKKVRGIENAIAHVKEIYGYWELVIQKLKEEHRKGDLNYQKLFIYQDSYPTGVRQDISEQVIKMRIPNYLILDRLMKRGATLVGTEDINLLADEWKIIKELEKLSLKQDQAEIKAKAQEINIRKAELLQKRDKFIAERINETLPENGTGILFIGRAHKAIEELDKLEEAGGLASPLRVIYL